MSISYGLCRSIESSPTNLSNPISLLRYDQTSSWLTGWPQPHPHLSDLVHNHKQSKKQAMAKSEKAHILQIAICMQNLSSAPYPLQSWETQVVADGMSCPFACEVKIWKMI